MLFNPASEIVLPPTQKRLPKYVLSEEEVERILAEADPRKRFGLRDRAILETLYSTGMRRREAVLLKLYDLDWDHGTAMIREGKGRRQRVVPIGERALGWVSKYLREARPTMVVPPDEGFVFVTHFGRPFEVDPFTRLVRGYLDRAGIQKAGAVHIFRHTAATLMLENGADIRYIQAMLGHKKLETTELYTHVSIRALKEVHTATHPAGKKTSASAALSAASRSDAEADAQAGSQEGSPPPARRSLLSDVALAKSDGEGVGADGEARPKGMQKE
jgi:integrase/recombinase XerD